VQWILYFLDWNTVVLNASGVMRVRQRAARSQRFDVSWAEPYHGRTALLLTHKIRHPGIDGLEQVDH
jgi:hypothetical protein